MLSFINARPPFRPSKSGQPTAGGPILRVRSLFPCLRAAAGASIGPRRADSTYAAYEEQQEEERAAEAVEKETKQPQEYEVVQKLSANLLSLSCWFKNTIYYYPYTSFKKDSSHL